jgi:hypothetical protein
MTKNEYISSERCECVLLYILPKQPEADRLTKEKDMDRLNKFKSSYIHYPFDELHPSEKKKVFFKFDT